MSNEILKQNIWILTSDKKSFDSIESITSSLTELYQKIFKKPKIINTNDQRNYDLFLNEEVPQKIIIVSPYVMHTNFFHLLLCLKSKPTFYIHLLGDFIRRFDLISNLNPLLNGKKIVLIAPSKSYESIIKQNTNNNATITTLPIPTSNFYHQKKLNCPTHKRNSTEVNICYTGRIDYQKNIIELIDLINNFQNKFKQYKIVLKIIGNIDKYDKSTLNSHTHPSDLFMDLNSRLAKNRIWIKNQTSYKLQKHYEKNDIFISLSTYHDESFGLSPREAALAGNSLLLTHWGGFKDLKLLPSKQCQFIKINSDFSIKQSEFDNSLIFLIKHLNKKSNIKNAKKILGINSIKKTYSNFFESKKTIKKFPMFKERIIYDLDNRQISKENYLNIYRTFWE